MAIFPKRLEIFQPNFTCLLCIPIYARLRIFIKIPASLTKLCHIKRDHPVKIMCAKCTPSVKTHFLTFFPKQSGIFSLNFTRLLNIHIYARMPIFVQLSPTVTKIYHIKCDHPACVSVDGGHSHSSSSSKFIVRLLQNGHRCITESQTLYKINLKPNNQ